jgi:hypothetical protein
MDFDEGATARRTDWEEILARPRRVTVEVLLSGTVDGDRLVVLDEVYDRFPQLQVMVGHEPLDAAELYPPDCPSA